MLENLILNCVMLDTLALPTNLTLVPEILTTASNYTEGLLGVAILIIVAFGSLFLTSSYGSTNSFITSSFIAMIVSLFLYFLGLLKYQYVFLMVSVFIIIFIISVSRKTTSG